MAAPTIDHSKQGATLTKLKIKEKPKKINKHILCYELSDWPRPRLDVEQSILAELTKCLSSDQNIFKSQKKDLESAKSCLRSQLAIGVSSVFRALEQDSLACVLVSGQAKPAMCVNHVIRLGQERGCALLVLDKLAGSVAKATDSNVTPLAIGFKNTGASGACDFAGVISLVKAHTSVRKVHHAAPEVTTQDTAGPGENCIWPISFNDADVKEVLSILERVVSKAPKETFVPWKGGKKKKDKKKVCLKASFKTSFSHQFEVGRRAVSHIMEQAGRMQLVLVTGEVRTYLATESEVSLTSSFLRQAVRQKCPVFCVPGMMEVLKPHFGGNVSFLGLKKCTDREETSEKYFESTVDKIRELMVNHTGLENGVLVTEGNLKADDDGATTDGQHKAMKEGSEEEDDEEDDYSYLYIMKKESKEYENRVKKEQDTVEEAKKNLNFSTDFISLSAGSGAKMPKAEVKNKKTKKDKAKGNDSNNDQPLFVLDRAGKNSNVMNIGPNQPKVLTTVNVEEMTEERVEEIDEDDMDESNTLETNDTSSEVKSPKQNEASFSLDRGGKFDFKKRKMIQTTENQPDDLTLGASAVNEDDDFGQIHQPFSEGKKGKKRKAEPDTSFISLTYNKTNIKTMVADVTKKKKKNKK